MIRGDNITLGSDGSQCAARRKVGLLLDGMRQALGIRMAHQRLVPQDWKEGKENPVSDSGGPGRSTKGQGKQSRTTKPL